MPKVVDHAARRAQISGITADLIAGGGIEAATIREIARASGYSKGVIEHYFDGKNELLTGALEWVNERYEERVADATAQLTGLAALKARLTATLPLDQAARKEWQVRVVFWGMAAINRELGKQQARRFGRAVKFFAGDIEAAVAACEMAPVEDIPQVARRLVNRTTGICIASLHNRSLYTRAFLLQEADDLVQQIAGPSGCV